MALSRWKTAVTSSIPNPLAKYFHTDAVSFASISPFPCLVTTSEPGSGKTTDVVVALNLRDFASDQRLSERVFQSPEIQKWRAGISTLHLFFDSVDEALLRIDNIGAVLASELRGLPIDRLRLRLACRPFDWPHGFEQRLREMFGEDKPWHLRCGLVRLRAVGLQ
jgi:hypothetical protein